MRRLLLILAAALAAASLSVPAAPASADPLPPPSPPAPAPAPALRCQVTIQVWANGFLINITVTNVSAQPVSGWLVRLRVSGSSRINQAWGVQVTQTGDVVVVRPAAAWNSTIPPGGSFNLGLLGTYTPPFQPPDQFEVVPGGPCQVVAWP